MNTKPVTVKVYLKTFEVEDLDQLAQKRNTSRSKTVATLIREAVKND